MHTARRNAWENGCIRQIAVVDPVCPLSPTIGSAFGEDSAVGERGPEGYRQWANAPLEN